MKINNSTDLILISGGTGSGKTTISHNIANDLRKKGKKVLIFEMDNYYFELSHWKGKKGEEINWDEPNSIDWNYLKSDLKKILDGQKVEKARFFYPENKYDHSQIITYEKSDVIIFEGIFALFDEEILNLSKYKIFVDADADTRFIRRIKRDSNRHSNYDFKLSSTLWITKIKPMHDKWVEPQKKLAKLIVQNNDDEIDIEKINPLDWLSKNY